MVLCFRFAKLVCFGIGLAQLSFCQEIPPETRRSAEVWLRAALDPLDQVSDTEQVLQFERVYHGSKSVSLLFKQGSVLLSKDLRKVLSVGLLGINSRGGQMNRDELVRVCKAFTNRAFGDVNLNWETTQLLDRTGRLQFDPAFVHNGIPVSDCGLAFTVDSGTGVITSVAVVGSYPLPAFENLIAPTILPSEARRSAIAALISSDAFNINLVHEPILAYRVPNFGPMLTEFSDRHEIMRRTKTKIKVYIVRVCDGDSWDPETNLYRDQITVFVDAVTGKAICVTTRASYFQMGSVSIGNQRVVHEAKFDKNVITLRKGYKAIEVKNPKIMPLELSKSVGENDYCWLNCDEGPKKLWFAKDGSYVWVLSNGKKIGGVPNKNLANAVVRLSNVSVTPFGSKKM